MKRHWFLPALPFIATSVVVLMACGSDDPSGSRQPDPNSPDPPVTQPGPASPMDVDNGFESDDPNAQSVASGGADAGAGSSSGSGSSSSGGAAPNAPGGDESGGGAERAIEEADIIKVEGNYLYALSQYGGLAVVDVTNPDQMKVVGRKRTNGIPFEMYVRSGRAYVMLNDAGRWVVTDSANGYGQWVQSSEVLALDISNPAAIAQLAEYTTPGSISDSRVVGDALYLVTQENGYCWGCDTKPGTVVTSFNIAGTSIAKIDQLTYRRQNDGYYYWAQRSVSATNERLYIGGPQWDWEPSVTNGHSVIQVVDITDPTGKLHKGAEVTVSGQINSRWQMDEHNGVLRVVSQHGNGWWGPNNSINPSVETFTVTSSNTITPLGQTELLLPKPESLRSVRFDGTRGYAITAERTDPLFTIDLTNPALPKQAGALEMPGWVFHMEPRGDRLIGFGYDDTTGNANLAVSLFDVSNMTQPKLLSRVSFGSGWGSFAEDQDRIHKSVRVLDEHGLLLVPFASYGRWTDKGCETPQSGIQLIDYTANSLTRRGLAPQHGQPRRALMVKSRLLAVSDRNVTAFDITSRDVPVKSNEIDLSNPAYRMVQTPNHIAAITNDWWSGEVMLSLTPKANADDANAVGKLSLKALAQQNQSTCGGYWGWTSWYEARLFSSGHYVYMTVPVYNYDYDSSASAKVVVASIDISDPANPTLVGKTFIPIPQSQGYYGYYGGCGMNYDGYAYYSMYGGAIVGAGEGIVQHGDRLAYLQLEHVNKGGNGWCGGGGSSSSSGSPGSSGSSGGKDCEPPRWVVQRRLHVIDFANPMLPFVHQPIELTESMGTTPLHLQGGVVLTSRWNAVTNKPGKVRFYVDRVDLNAPKPVRLASINTPGSLVHVDGPSSRIVTADYTAQMTKAKDWQDCQTKLGQRAYFDYTTENCVQINRNFKLSDIADTKVTLRQTFVPPSQNIAGVQLSDDRIFVTHYPVYSYDYNGTYYESKIVERGGMWAIGGIRAGQLSIASNWIGESQWPLAANGTKVALSTNAGSVQVFDTKTAVPQLLGESQLRGYGYSTHVLLDQTKATCSLGEFGIQTLHF